MLPQFFDIHTHLNDRRFHDDREQVLERCREHSVWGIIVGTDRKSSQDAVIISSFAERGVFASVGIHPADAHERFDPVLFEEFLKQGRVVAVGECGLDYTHLSESEEDTLQEKAIQMNLFSTQVDFAIEHDLPLIIHCRDKDKAVADAHRDVLDLLRSKKESAGARLRGDIHFFSQTEDIAREYFALGFSISFTGVVTFSHEYDAVIRAAPIDRLMAETDCPYVSPVPYRGTRNEPMFVKEVVKKIAEIRGEEYEMVRSAFVHNACRMFGILED